MNTPAANLVFLAVILVALFLIFARARPVE